MAGRCSLSGEQHKLFAHHGYVYCMLLVRGLLESTPGAEVLLTGSGDGSVKIWHLGESRGQVPTEIMRLSNSAGSVLSIDVDGPFLYCGLSGGAVNIWNLDSRQIIKKITCLSEDVWAIDVINGSIICGDSSGIVKVCAVGMFHNLCIWTTDRSPDYRSSTLALARLAPGKRMTVYYCHLLPALSKIG